MLVASQHKRLDGKNPAERITMKNIKKKVLGLASAFMLLSAFLFSFPVSAGSVTSPSKIKGSYATGSTTYYSTFVTATTSHIENNAKTVTVKGYCNVYGNVGYYGQASNGDYSPNYVTVNLDIIGYSPCGSIGIHSVNGSSWVGYSYSGLYFRP